MDALALFQRIAAASAEEARPRASMLHYYLPDELLVVVGYHAAGAPGDVLGLIYGTQRSLPRTVVMPNPRNIDLRFRRLSTFADHMIDHLAPLMVIGTDNLCRDAPSFLCPNQATAEWLCATLGRSLRYRRTDGEFPVPASVPVLGAHLSFLESRRRVPGSSMVLAATDVLRSHWWVGQTDAESENLATLLAWVDPPLGSTPRAAAEAAELACPAAGPVPDPEWERVLADEIDAVRAGRSTEAAVEQMIIERLSPAWENTWAALDVATGLPEAPSVAERWKGDRRSWTKHVERVIRNEAWFTRVPTPRQAAFMLGNAETAQADFERQVALDDPLIMAGLIAAGEALEGEVVALDLTRREQGSRNRVYRPHITVRPLEPFTKPIGTLLWWTLRVALAVDVASVEPNGDVVLRAYSGIGKGVPSVSNFPSLGSRTVFSPHGPQSWFPNTLPDHVPWTHQLPAPQVSD